MAYIEDTNLIEEIKSLKISLGGKDIFPDEAKESVLRVISEQPIADVVEVKHGEWKNPSIKRFEGRYLVCSECDVMLPIITELLTFDFCPRCGAKMDGRSDEG